MRPGIKKYIERNKTDYSWETLSGQELSTGQQYSMIAVIPLYAELEYISETLKSINNAIMAYKSEKILITAVVNNPPAAQCNPAKIANNQKTLEMFRSGNLPQEMNSAFIWIDASSPGKEIPADGGVGAARKLGMDIALSIFHWNSDPILLCLDGDTIIEENYFSEVRRFYNDNPKISAAGIQFIHRQGKTPEEEQAIRLYENYMDDYVEKLRNSHSPYAYHAVGSTITCRAEAYVKAGGMRPKKAGEDFYFLQALRKLSPDSPIGRITGTTVHPSPRCSDRVPFGTGAKMTELLSDNTTKFTGRYLYNPNIFTDLEKILSFANSADLRIATEEWYPELPTSVTEFLDSCYFRKIWPKILKNTPDRQEKIRWAFHTWFDAFRTLKFIHFCENRNPEKYGRIPAQSKH